MEGITMGIREAYRSSKESLLKKSSEKFERVSNYVVKSAYGNIPVYEEVKPVRSKNAVLV